MNTLLTLPLRFFQWVFADRVRVVVAFIFIFLFHLTHVLFGLNFKSIYVDRDRASLAIEYKEHLLMGARRLAYFEKPDLAKLFNTEGGVLSSSFEYGHDATRPQFISDRKAMDGDYALVKTDRAPYSPSFRVQLEEGINTLKVSFSYWSLYPDSITLVTERKADQFWKATRIHLEATHADQWKEKSFEVTLLMDEHSEPFKMYLWKDSESLYLIYIDALKLEQLHTVSEVDQGE